MRGRTYRSNVAVCGLSYSTDGQRYTDVGEAFGLREGYGLWTGAKFGLFAASEGSTAPSAAAGYADFKQFTVK
ncbi:hypothetical protein [Paenibacillus sp. NFR01]|uniref:beta-xylosidase family glycoside hydrolase n=1 Tax=Paenibacillus sp. NFR01 TaxID=1566279 RepID=UPI0011133AFB|nr:hypothetical protein [Paenibacillus sp. NFR01]